MPALQIPPQNINTAGFYPGAGFLQIAEHSVVNQPFAQLHDLNVDGLTSRAGPLPTGQAGCNAFHYSYILLDTLWSHWFNRAFTPDPAGFDILSRY